MANDKTDTVSEAVDDSEPEEVQVLSLAEQIVTDGCGSNSPWTSAALPRR